MTENAGPGTGPGVGGLLRASRLRIGEDLRDVAAALYIRYNYLNAIEEGRYEALPGPTYAVGFVRVYAEHLGLDAGEVVRRFKAETAALSEMKELVFPSPLPESGVPSGAILFMGILIAGLAYGIWYINSTHDKSIADLIPAVPERFATLLGEGSKDAGSGAPASAAPATPQTSEPAVSNAPTRSEPSEAAIPKPTGDAGTTAPAIPPVDRPTVEVTAVAPPEPASAPDTERVVIPPENVAAELETPAASEPPSAEPTPPLAAASATETPSASAPEEPMPAGDVTPERAIPGRTSETAAAPDAAAVPVPVENAERPMAGPPETGARSTEMVEPPRPPSPPVNEFSGLTRDGGQVGSVNGSVPVDVTEGASATDVTAAPTGAAVTPSVETASAEAATSGNSPEGSAGRIVVREKSASWIQIRDEVAKQLLMTQLMQQGDTYRVPDRPGLKLLTGNAGALEILIDGEIVPAIGPAGAVRRDVALDIERLKNGTAAEN